MSSHERKNTGREDYELGKEYYKQQKYAEAEQLFLQSAQQREKVLGTEYKDTLWSKYRLAVALHDQQKYAEAKQLVREFVQQQEKVLGAEYKDTLESKHLLQVLSAIAPPVSINTTAATSQLGDHIRATIQSHTDPKHGLYHIRCQASWQILVFCRQQLDGQYEQLRQVITLTGTPAHAQAASCEDFVQAMWPSQGLKLLDAMVLLLKDKSCGRVVKSEQCTEVN
jgi:tetratricopeptide (TPR) repeat protein